MRGDGACTKVEELILGGSVESLSIAVKGKCVSTDVEVNGVERACEVF